MSLSHLQIGSNDGRTIGFINQGQVDWVLFGKTIWQATSAVLQRFATAGVQPVTLGASLALANEFRLSQLGRQRMDEALKALHCHHGFEKLLSFGFGYNSFVNLITETQLGVNFVALCSGLCQSHGVEMSAHILAGLWKESGFPDEYEPSHNQFVLIIEACSGVLAKSTLDDTVDLMLGDELKVTVNYDSDGSDGASLQSEDIGRPRIRGSAAPDVAKVLHKLFRISTGVIEQITVVGGYECAFIAAFAVWALGLRVQVMASNGELIFTSSLDELEVQVILRYQHDIPQMSTQLTSTIYYLKEATGMFVENHPSNLDLIIRTPWAKVLSRVFGASFNDLLKTSDLLSTYLGSGARVYKALATGEVYTGEFESMMPRGSFNSYVESSYGQGLIASVVTFFPELDVPGFSKRMGAAADKNVTNAMKSATLALQSLSQLCRCCSCSPNDGDDDDDGDETGSAYCLCQMANTIFQITVQLACAEWNPSLRPSVTGIVLFYSNVTRFITGKNSSADEVITFGLQPSEERYLYRDLLHDVSSIFDGYTTPFRPHKGGPPPTAMSRDGICYYLGALSSFSSNAALVRRVHIIPGHIERGNQRVDFVYDGDVWFSNIPDGEKETMKSSELPTSMETGDIEVKGMVMERGKSSNALYFFYKVTTDNLSAMIQPGRLTRRVLEKTGYLSCYRDARCKPHLMGTCFAVRRGWRFPDKQTDKSVPTFYTWTFDSEIARCLALETYNRTQLVTRGDTQNQRHEPFLFIRHDECLSCSMATIYRYGIPKWGHGENLRPFHIL